MLDVGKRILKHEVRLAEQRDLERESALGQRFERGEAEGDGPARTIAVRTPLRAPSAPISRSAVSVLPSANVTVTCSPSSAIATMRMFSRMRSRPKRSMSAACRSARATGSCS